MYLNTNVGGQWFFWTRREQKGGQSAGNILLELCSGQLGTFTF